MGIVCFGTTGAVERVHSLWDDDDEGGADQYAHADG